MSDAGGVSPEQASLIAELRLLIGNALAGKPCRIFGSELRIRIAPSSVASPHISVISGSLETSPDDRNAAMNPILLVEVLSPETSESDRYERARRYRKITALVEYAMFTQGEHHIEVQRRTPRGSWEILDFKPGDQLELKSIDVSLSVDTIYANAQLS